MPARPTRKTDQGFDDGADDDGPEEMDAADGFDVPEPSDGGESDAR